MMPPDVGNLGKPAAAALSLPYILREDVMCFEILEKKGDSHLFSDHLRGAPKKGDSHRFWFRDFKQNSLSISQ